jgi:D-alanyl-D-alanine carboxypeptidase
VVLAFESRLVTPGAERRRAAPLSRDGERPSKDRTSDGRRTPRAADDGRARRAQTGRMNSDSSPTTIDPRTPPGPTRRRRTAGASIAALAGAAVFAMTVPVAGAAAHVREAPRPVGPRLQAILDRAVSSPATTFPGVALSVRRPGHASWSAAAGQANIETGRRLRRDDRFRVGSVMKTFVAAATLQLVEEGKLALDDPLPAVLAPRVIARLPGADRITVRMLLNHTSGIADYADARVKGEIAADPHRVWTVDELLDRAAALPRTGAPGERWAYSNANYNLLGLVLEQATGKPWRAVIRERVIDRLHLAHTTLPPPGHVVRGRDLAHGYEVVNGRLRDFSDVDSSVFGAPGGHTMLTTSADLSRFVRGLFAGKLFQHRDTLAQMRTFVPASDPDGLAGYGLGLERYTLPGGLELVGHVGETAGYRAYMFHLPAHHIDLVMVTTAPDDPMPVLTPAIKLLLA